MSLTNVELLVNEVIADVTAGTNFSFVPSLPAGYVLQVRPQFYGEYYLDWGPAKFVRAAGSLPPAIALIGRATLTGNQFQVDFDVANYRSGMSFQLEKLPHLLSTNWMTDAAASFLTDITNSRFRATTPTGGAAQGFYRIRGD